MMESLGYILLLSLGKCFAICILKLLLEAGQNWRVCLQKLRQLGNRGYAGY